MISSCMFCLLLIDSVYNRAYHCTESKVKRVRDIDSICNYWKQGFSITPDEKISPDKGGSTTSHCCWNVEIHVCHLSLNNCHQIKIMMESRGLSANCMKSDNNQQTFYLSNNGVWKISNKVTVKEQWKDQLLLFGRIMMSTLFMISLFRRALNHRLVC